MTTWSDSDDDSTKEECKKQVVNIYFIFLEKYENVVNFLTSNDNLQPAFEELYIDFEKFGLRISILRKKKKSLEKELKNYFIKNLKYFSFNHL